MNKEERAKRDNLDPTKTGYGKHEYRHIDPALINLADYAQGLRGEQEYLGDVREYNSAYNSKHPDNDVSLDDISRIGTIFETDASSYEGSWEVTELAATHKGIIFARVQRANDPADTPTRISAVDLGVQQGKDNLFPQVKTRIVTRGKVGREQRERLTKRK